MLVDLSDLAPKQAKAIGKTYKYVVWLLNYAASHPMAIIRYKASDMIFLIHADASFISAIRTHSQADGYPYLSDNSDGPPNNVSINTIWKITKNVMGSAAEAEIGSTYINTQDALPLRTCLI